MPSQAAQIWRTSIPHLGILLDPKQNYPKEGHILFEWNPKQYQAMLELQRAVAINAFGSQDPHLDFALRLELMAKSYECH